MKFYFYIIKSRIIFQVQTNFDMVGEKQFLITIPDAHNLNHVVVFLTGAVAFPEGYAGLGKLLSIIYFVEIMLHRILKILQFVMKVLL